ncbi:MAG TPA: hypothetical protein VMT99_02350 [Candidatus Paceibacterota bacterium]|nr:hypothetical protein [Candidatus Paceibacterota bacterium]
MGLWALIVATFIIQEFATTAIVLVTAMKAGFALWPIHIIWAVGTVIDMYVGYELGRLLKTRLKGKRAVAWIDRSAHKVEQWLGGHGTNVALLLLSIVDFPYLNAFIGAWLDVPLGMTMLFTFIGNFGWYLALWGTVLGLSAFIKNSSIILLVVIVIGVISRVGFELFERSRHPRR